MKTVEVPFWGRTNRLPVDPFDEQVRYTFTNGQCHSFARALHQLTGWPLVILAYDDDIFDGDHVVVERPDGMYVDVFGAWEPGERWSNLPYAIPVSEDEVEDLGWDKQDPKAARPFAQAVLRLDGVMLVEH